MAKYTITLNECLNLFTTQQSETYNNLLSTCVPAPYSDDFKRAFYLKFRERDVQAGTPAGFLLDLEESALCTKYQIQALFDRYAKDGYFEVSYADRKVQETETPNITQTANTTRNGSRTPNLTQTTTENGNNTETPNTMTTTTEDKKHIFSNTPDSSGVVNGGYASEVATDHNTLTAQNSGTLKNEYGATNTTTNTGDEKTSETGTETRTETGTRTRNLTETRTNPALPVYNLVKEFPQSLMTEILLLFSDCFMLLY